jgi:hypothetical protein
MLELSQAVKLDRYEDLGKSQSGNNDSKWNENLKSLKLKCGG